MAAVTDEWGTTEILANDSEEFRNYHRDGTDILRKALDLYGDGQFGGEWKPSTEDKESGDKVYWRKSDLGNVYAVVGTIKCDPAKVLHCTWDDGANMNKWNPNIKEFKLLQQLGPQSQLVTNASEPILGGLVSSRDFVDVRIWRKVGNAVALAARSVQYEALPPQKGRVRANNKLGFFRMSPADGGGPTQIVWISCMDLKGMLPKSVVERASNSFLLDYMRYLRKHLEEH